MKTAKTNSGRLLALDILRGITIAGMILVNNPGSWGNIYAPLRHAEWNGLTPTDLVFPFFMFIMGVSTYFSLRKYDFKLTGPCVWKIVRRAFLIYFIGVFIAWFNKFMHGLSGDQSIVAAAMCFDHLRVLGVMPRLGLCYGLGAILALALKPRRVPWIIAILLAVYSILLLAYNGLIYSEDNIISVVDRYLVGPDHMYTENVGGERLKFDPEGLLGTIPSIAHMLIGFFCGGLILRTKDNNLRINYLFIVGTILTFSGFLLDFGIPINKKIWSPSFVLTTCGLASLLLGLLIWIIDIKNHKGWCRFFEAFGVNPLFLYCLGGILSILFTSIHVGDTTIKGLIYNGLILPVCHDNATLSSLIFALLFVGLNWIVAFVLYKKKIYIKI